jgi:hypothetical protein
MRRVLILACVAFVVAAPGASAMPVRDGNGNAERAALARLNEAHVKQEQLALQREATPAPSPAPPSGDTQWWAVGAALAAVGVLALTTAGLRIRRRTHGTALAAK